MWHLTKTWECFDAARQQLTSDWEPAEFSEAWLMLPLAVAVDKLVAYRAHSDQVFEAIMPQFASRPDVMNLQVFS